MDGSLRWDEGRSALRTLRQAEALLFKPAALDWFEALQRQAGGSDPWLDFERLLRMALGEAQPAAVDESPAAAVRPAVPAWADMQRSARHQVADGPPSQRASNRSVIPDQDLTPPPRTQALAPATPARSLARLPSIAEATPAVVHSSAASGGEVPGLREAAFAPRFPGTQRTQRNAEDTETEGLASKEEKGTEIPDSKFPSPLRPPSSSVSSAFQRPSRDTTASNERPVAAQAPQQAAAAAAALSAGRIIEWPRLGARPAPKPDEFREADHPSATPTGRTRVVEGLPALKGLLQSALAQSQASQGIAASPSVEVTESVDPLRAGPIDEDALVDKVIDRLDERMREQSIRHFGFTGGLTP